ncbi:MAG TPA: archease [Candidatus Wunengus sp. YC63]|uniref:archease n=1 Tax=Candidatus Wunengus sp. YC63 TaxID=3367699 RepID=UPI00402883CE
MPKYILIDHTADIGIDVFGTTIEELFTNAAFALFDIIADLSTVECKAEYQVKISGVDREQLLVIWLSELLYLHDVKYLLFKDFHITDMKENQLTASVSGEVFNDDKHVIKTEIKAVTYHGLSIVQENHQWKARVIFDL